MEEGILQRKEPTDSLAHLLQQEGFSIAVVSADVTYEDLEALLPAQKKGNIISQCN